MGGVLWRVAMQSLKQFRPLVVGQLWSQDQGFKNVLDFMRNQALYPALDQWQTFFPEWQAWSNEASRPEKFPRIEKFDSVGNAVERVILPLETKTFRKQVVEQGIFKNSSETEMFAKIYLLAQLGESGVTCPLACTDGLRRALTHLGSDFLKEHYLPKLTSTEFPLAGAQFVTEQTGGSDVGAIEGRAVPQVDGSWSIFAEKWYCSACDEFFLVAARPAGAAAGTEGLAIFFVPRALPVDGPLLPNLLDYRRLKDKLGTQSLPTAEINFNGSKAWAIGKVEEGFHNLMNYILNVSRIHNAANSLGLHRRAFAEAKNYAEQRIAFGGALIQFPLIQEYLVSMLTHLTAKRNLFFKMLALIDKNGLLPEAQEERLWQRFMINLLKYRTAHQLTEHVKTAILVFGANGIIQDFSIVPRLLRDALIVETWEGPHNILCLQILRDSRQFDFFGRVQKEGDRYEKLWPEGILAKSRVLYLSAGQSLREILTAAHLQDRIWVQTHAKRIVDDIASRLEIGNLVEQAAKQNDSNLWLQVSYLCHREWGHGSGFENPVLNHLPQLGHNLIAEKAVDFKMEQF